MLADVSLPLKYLRMYNKIANSRLHEFKRLLSIKFLALFFFRLNPENIVNRTIAKYLYLKRDGCYMSI